ncbi:MAG: Release factor glutamine methyltransferase [Bacteroidetes bacterium]|nr:Release factor glutamine methyltransferase [Bacteroidota bacterium]
MKIASNKIKDIVRFFKEELGELYIPEELAVITRYCFEEFTAIKGGDLHLHEEETVSESELLKFSFAVKDLKKERPLQYIFGKADFYGLKFFVNEHVLIPRPETEELVHQVITDLSSPTSILQPPFSILDIGTGSGCIPVTLKKHLPQATVSALDVSEPALELAKRNAELNATEVDFFKEDILSPSAEFFSSSYNIIVSNPPYIRFSEKGQMKKNVLEYEPHLALFTEGEDALLFYRKIADAALKILRPGGRIYFEINEAFGPETEQLLVAKGFKNVRLLKDMSNKNRILRGEL